MAQADSFNSLKLGKRPLFSVKLGKRPLFSVKLGKRPLFSAIFWTEIVVWVLMILQYLPITGWNVVLLIRVAGRRYVRLWSHKSYKKWFDGSLGCNYPRTGHAFTARPRCNDVEKKTQLD